MMNKQAIFRKIGSIISEINDQYQYLLENPDDLNDLELELFIANSHFLSEHLTILKKINETDSSRSLPGQTMSLPEEKSQVIELPVSTGSALPEERNTTEEAIAEERIKADAIQDSGSSSERNNLSKSSSDSFFSLDEASEAQEEDETISQLQEEDETIPELQEEEAPFLMNQETEEVKEIPPVSAPVQPAPSFTNSKTEAPSGDPTEPVATLNQILSAQNQQGSIASQYSQQPVKDLKSIISLNDKLVFVRDLFNGYSLAYSEAIELVNRFDKLEDATTFLTNNYAAKNNWADKPNTVDKFFELLSRKFNR